MNELSAEPDEESGLSQDELTVGDVFAERYRVIKKIGQGAMGAVYKAEHIHMRKFVALKVLRGDVAENEEIQARFEREAIAAAKIEHPGIVAATDFGRYGGDSYYLALEFVDGLPLSDLLHSGQGLELERAYLIAVQVVAALTAAHNAGVIHRDLKPENIMVSDGGGEDFVKVLDFGIAKLHEQELPDSQRGLTKAGSLFGTPEYMAPEQARGVAVDARADLYAVGMIFYEMLKGRSAFASDDLVEVLTSQLTMEPPPLPEEIPEEVRNLIGHLLAKRPEQRISSAEKLYDALAVLGDRLGFSMPSPRTAEGTRVDVRPVHRRSHETLPIDLEAHPSIFDGLRPAEDRPTFMDHIRHAGVQQVAVGNRGVPLWLIVLFLVVGLVGGGYSAFYFKELRAEQKVQADAEREQKEAVDRARRVAALQALAVEGDREALSALREEADAYFAVAEEETEAAVILAADYMALGQGYQKIRSATASVDFYKKAVELDPHLAASPQLLSDVRTALAERDAVEQSLDFALTHLGALGADLVYDTWNDNLGKVGMTRIVVRAQKLIFSGELDHQATESLRVALALARAKRCTEYSSILESAVQHADERSVRKLKRLKKTTGCGEKKKLDCFACLRTPEGLLDRAIEAAASRPAPPHVKNQVASPEQLSAPE